MGGTAPSSILFCRAPHGGKIIIRRLSGGFTHNVLPVNQLALNIMG